MDERRDPVEAPDRHPATGYAGTADLTDGDRDPRRDDVPAAIGPEGYSASTRLPSLNSLKGMEVCDEQGEKVGKVADVYLDHEARYVRYLAISTGFLGRGRGVVPVDDVTFVDEGDGHLTVPYSRDVLGAAPALDDDEITPDREREIYDHYRRAGYWEETRAEVRARQATPAPTPTIAEAEAVAARNRAIRVRRMED